MIANIDGYGLLKVTKIELIKMIRSAFGFGLMAAKELVEAAIELCPDGSHPGYLVNKVLIVAKHVNDGSIKIVDCKLVLEDEIRFRNCDGDFTFSSSEVWGMLAGEIFVQKVGDNISLSKKLNIDNLV